MLLITDIVYIALNEVLVLLVDKLCWLSGGDSVSGFVEILLLITILVVVLTRVGPIQLENIRNAILALSK